MSIFEKKFYEVIEFLYPFITGYQLRVHYLKTWPNEFNAVKSGVKKFDVRKDDRGFQIGDVVLLKEWSPDQQYSGAECRRIISYILRGPQAEDFGLKPGFCVLGLK